MLLGFAKLHIALPSTPLAQNRLLYAVFVATAVSLSTNINYNVILFFVGDFE